MDDNELLVRLYVEVENGDFLDIGPRYYQLSEFGGVLPAVGDIIVDDGVRSGLERGDARNRTLYEVVARYFVTVAVGHPWANFLVKERPGRDQEVRLLGN